MVCVTQTDLYTVLAEWPDHLTFISADDLLISQKDLQRSCHVHFETKIAKRKNSHNNSSTYKYLFIHASLIV